MVQVIYSPKHGMADRTNRDLRGMGQRAVEHDPGNLAVGFLPGVVHFTGPSVSGNLGQALEQGGSDGRVVRFLGSVVDVAAAHLLQGRSQDVGPAQIFDDQRERSDQLLLLFGHFGTLEERLDGRIVLEQVLVEDIDEPVGLGRDGSKALFQDFDLKSHNHTPHRLFGSIQPQHGGEQPSGAAAICAPSLK